MEKICIKTFGCSLNQADTERIKAILAEKGFGFTKNIDESELIILNSCAVKGPTESKFFTLLEKLKQQHKKVVIAGCISQAMPEKLAEYSKIGTDQIDAIADVVEETLNGNAVSVLVQENKNKLEMKSSRENPLVEIIPISKGCMGNCTFCITKIARPGYYSFSAEHIVTAVGKAVSEGVKEIYLTSQDNGCWGFDLGSDLAELLEIVCKIPGDYMIRVGMMNPNHVLKNLNKLIAAFKHPKVYKFLHIPVQSGNNYVLEDMKRCYLAEDYEHVVNSFKKEIPEITISTDIIVGYPTEKDAYFKDTLSLVQRTKPDVINISRFWPRSHTPAYKLKQLPGNLVKERTIELVNAFKWMAHNENKKWKGWKGKVLMTEKGKENSYIGRNSSYKQIVVFDKVELGKWYDVIINDATEYDLRGKVVNDS
ncbi:MAG: tRNA (N(6)-L-threonylcarbamoyladenosine(37)-C(2))-methylthiotransferase [Candidatus Woesearchaeota archaeon]